MLGTLQQNKYYHYFAYASLPAAGAAFQRLLKIDKNTITTLNLARVHFESQHQKSGIYCLLASVILHHFLHFVGI